jgi:hypothetical protein
MLTVKATAVAGGGDIFANLESLMSAIRNGIIGISTTAALVALGICGYLFMFSGDPRKVSDAKAWAIRVAVGWFIINGGMMILAFLRPFISGGVSIA